jgi:cyanophycinase-like exopeptidase
MKQALDDKRGNAAAVKFNAEYPDQLGIEIDEETGLIVKGDRAEVIGRGTVSIYDGRRPGGANPVVLRSGDRYDLAAGK